MNAVSPDPLRAIPRAAAQRLALRVTQAAQRALRQGHPWLYAEAITDLRGDGGPGDLAVIFDDRRRFLAIGLYDPGSPIRVRVLQHGTPATIDRAWLRDRLGAAAEIRAGLPASGTTGYRLVHGENDGLPGLVVDRYDTALVVKLYTPAWIPWLADVCAALAEVCPARAVMLRLSREAQARPADLHELADGMALVGDAPNGPVMFGENGLCFAADLLRGQKTGFFLDQRDNRARVERLAAGRRTLNVFAYTGGFSLYAARGGAPTVTSVDISAGALADAERNFALNRDDPGVAAAQHVTLAGDAFRVLADLRAQGRKFDLVIVDPPALAVREGQAAGALDAYARLTRLALGVAAPGGALMLASCSARVPSDDFYAAVLRAATMAGRPLTEIERTGHALDHPIGFPEGAYLKALFAFAP